MPIGRIEEKAFLSPREAIDIIGPASFGSDWKPDLPIDHPLMKDALHNLYVALKSGLVEAYHDEYNGMPRPLRPIDIEDEFFRIDLKRNCCIFGPVESNPNRMNISRRGLEEFLRLHRSSPAQTKINEIKACHAWLADLFVRRDEASIGPSDALYVEAKKQFPKLSKRAFKKVRHDAAVEVNRPELLAGGRPRNRIKNQTTARH